MLGSLKNMLSKKANRFSGRTDFLEAVCASAALVAAADGSISDDEVVATSKSVNSNPTLCSGFKANQISKTIDTMLERAQSGRTGRLGQYKEIEDVSGQEELGEVVYLTALDVAESDGNIDTSERKVLNKIADKLGINTANYDDV